uniref:Uncharacterized protein n=1 Tax=Anguilla anguilla TaxID=7936 RepID=A0A0E9T3C7_ANGAN
MLLASRAGKGMDIWRN